MSNVSNEDLNQVLEELELTRELTFVNEPALGSGGFGSAHKARSVMCHVSQSARFP